jgi:NAD(P)-dependent dehydrogenase (short-subunit alcohol dehydrogenase family)
MPTALITGASRGLGRALAAELAARGWTLVVDGRDPATLATAAQRFRAAGAQVHDLPGDVSDDAHRWQLAHLAARSGPLDLVVNNASTLGPLPMRPLAEVSADDLAAVFAVNTVAPLALVQLLLPELAPDAAVLNLSSDAAVQAYPTWGAYGSSKAALDQLTAVFAAESGTERPQLRWYAVDPGDMQTDLHAAAEPGEDQSGLPLPETVAPALVRLLADRPPSGRYRVAGVAVTPAPQPAAAR